MPGKIDQLVLPGTELEVKPLEDRRAPLVLRIAEAYPHGSAFRYDLVYYGLEPGDYDLRNYLRRKDGSALGELPPIPVKVDPVLPPGQVEPNPLALERSPSLGGYRLLLAIGRFALVRGAGGDPRARPPQAGRGRGGIRPARYPGRPAQAPGGRGRLRARSAKASMPSLSGS